MCALLMRELMKGSVAALMTNVQHSKISRTVAASSGVDCRNVMVSMMPNFFMHSSASQKQALGL